MNWEQRDIWHAVAVRCSPLVQAHLQAVNKSTRRGVLDARGARGYVGRLAVSPWDKFIAGLSRPVCTKIGDQCRQWSHCDFRRDEFAEALMALGEAYTFAECDSIWDKTRLVKAMTAVRALGAPVPDVHAFAAEAERHRLAVLHYQEEGDNEYC